MTPKIGQVNQVDYFRSVHPQELRVNTLCGFIAIWRQAAGSHHFRECAFLIHYQAQAGKSLLRHRQPG
jgi:hypothetical protein